ncbi:hypothetical protein [Vibrio parahaemolyticus]|uniref:hypothetical protein n=1 Tax=Vibrio parahaemolyticus TaxID=670 RepID=UPI0025548839|nr:hypothetical protein [Vibrio parahaemolyticus]
MPQQKQQNAVWRYLADRMSERSTWAAIGALFGGGVFSWLNAGQVQVLVDNMPGLVAGVSAIAGAFLLPTSGGKK